MFLCIPGRCDSAAHSASLGLSIDASSSASRVHRCRRHSSSASSESLARYLLLPTASAPAKRLSAAQFLSPPSLLYVPLMPLFTFCFTSYIQLPFPVAAQSGPVCHRDYGPRRAALRVVTPHSVRLSCMPVSSYGCLHPYPLIISRDRSRVITLILVLLPEEGNDGETVGWDGSHWNS